MAVTIRQISEACGLPIYIVGRVLDNYRDIGEDVRGRVLDAARSLGYTPDADDHTHNIGVLMADESDSGLTHPFFAAILNSFKKEAESRGYDVTFINQNVGKQNATYLEHCRYRNVDGLFLACVDFYSPQIEELLNGDIPCVTIDYPWPNQSCVSSDNTDGVKQLVEYAVSLGHRRIALISGQCNSKVTETRRAVYFQTMKEHDLEVPDGYLMEARYSDNGLVREKVAALLQREDRPSCILLPDDTTYFGAQEIVREHELRIPADISLAGYDGIPLTQTLRPQLTTVRQKSEEMGRKAALCLIERLEQPDRPVEAQIVVPVELIKGSTIGWCNEW